MLVRLMAVRRAPYAAETIVVGDMEVDFEFARAAGCRVVLIPAARARARSSRGSTPDALSRLASAGASGAWLER